MATAKQGWALTLHPEGDDRPLASEARALVALGAHTHPAGMFVVTEAEAAAIRAVYEQRGELSAAAELRQLFPAVTVTAQALACARTTAGWKPLSVPPRLAAGQMPAILRHVRKPKHIG